MSNMKNLVDHDLEGWGKPCPCCNAPMISIYGTLGERLCSNGKCGHTEKWRLDKGQSYLLSRGKEHLIT